MPGDPGGEERGLLRAVHAGPEVDVVGAEGDPRELGVRVGVLDGQPPAGQHGRAPGPGRGEALGRDPQGLRPAGRGEFTGVRVPHQRGGEPVGLLRVAEREAALVADPLLVDLVVLGRHAPHHLAAAVVGAGGAAARAVLAHARRGHQVERAGAEPVGRRGQRAHRADLDGVAGEVRLEGVALAGADLLERAAFQQLDHRVAGDLLREAGAPGAQHAPFAVEQHLRGDGHGLVERPLDAVEPGLRVAGGHRLVLEGALAALVADRAVQRVVDEQQLHHPALRLLGDGRAEVGLDDHAVGAGDGAGGHRLALALDLHDALPARAGRVEQRMVAEPRDLDAELLGGADDQGPLGHRELDAVDGQRHQVGILLRRHAFTSW